VSNLSKKEVGVGIVGLSFVGENAHLSSFRSILGAKLVAVEDLDVARASEVAENDKIEAAYSNHSNQLCQTLRIRFFTASEAIRNPRATPSGDWSREAD
jgi:predicted homoserine dehydrogenase-like protein